MTVRVDVRLLAAGNSLKTWRDNAGLSQEGAAKRIQSTQATWGAWERGERVPDVVFAFALEKLTDRAVLAESWAVARPTSRIARGVGADDADQTGPQQVVTAADIARIASG